jgi:hypothetical protein
MRLFLREGRLTAKEIENGARQGERLQVGGAEIFVEADVHDCVLSVNQ